MAYINIILGETSDSPFIRRIIDNPRFLYPTLCFKIAMPSPTTFSQFSKLPSELQQPIWKCALLQHFKSYEPMCVLGLDYGGQKANPPKIVEDDFGEARVKNPIQFVCRDAHSASKAFVSEMKPLYCVKIARFPYDGFMAPGTLYVPVPLRFPVPITQLLIESPFKGYDAVMATSLLPLVNNTGVEKLFIRTTAGPSRYGEEEDPWFTLRQKPIDTDGSQHITVVQGKKNCYVIPTSPFPEGRRPSSLPDGVNAEADTFEETDELELTALKDGVRYKEIARVLPGNPGHQLIPPFKAEMHLNNWGCYRLQDLRNNCERGMPTVKTISLLGRLEGQGEKVLFP
ncbi:hypothetical protein F5Y16DRAFT_371156 [Xylariaceae sp. FL0255]|nr:hypothetical protein F5Y16DRAFT_371156 [Xylariaceae sp. FL0255]